MITKENIIGLLESDNLIIQSYVYSDRKKKYWKLQKALIIVLSNNFSISIPIGYKYDMATIPKVLWSIVRPFNQALFGFLIHDFLYTNQKEHNLSRKEADNEFLFWANLINPDNKFDNYIRYSFIRLFGWMWWYNFV